MCPKFQYFRKFTAEPSTPVKWYDKPMGQFYTVGESLICAAVFLGVFTLMILGVALP